MAKISNNSLLLVQTGESKHSITAFELKEYTAPKAVQGERAINLKGVPGVMFPNEQSFDYNPETGELSLKGEEATRELVGYIGYQQNLPPGTDLENLPVTLKPSQAGNEFPGQYYIVIDPAYKYLTNDWGTGYYDEDNPDPSNIKRVYVGDVVVKEDNGDWVVEHSYVQSLYMLKQVDEYPHISQIVESTP